MQLYEKSLNIQSYQTLEGVADNMDWDAPVGTTYPLTSTSTVTIIDPFEDYVQILKQCFDWDALQQFAQRPGVSILFDGMHGAGGPFAQRILVQELGLPQVSGE